MKNYKDPVIAKLIKLLEEHGPKELKGAYYYGDPGVVNKSLIQNKPAVFLSYEGINIDDDTSGELGDTSTIVINIVYDMTRDFGQGQNSWSHMSVAYYMAGRGDNFDIHDDTIVGALRNHEDISDPDGQLWIDLGSLTEVEFDAMTRGKGLVTSEAIVRVQVRHTQLRKEYRD